MKKLVAGILCLLAAYGLYSLVAAALRLVADASQISIFG